MIQIRSRLLVKIEISDRHAELVSTSFIFKGFRNKFGMTKPAILY